MTPLAGPSCRFPPVMSRLLALVSRTPRVLFALWLVVAMTQPTGAHACPVHDRALVQAIAAHGMMPGMAMHHAEHDASDPGQPSHEQCHCLGDCCTGVATPLPAVAVSIAAPASALAAEPLPIHVEQPFDSPGRLLPPATAPPSAAVA